MIALCAEQARNSRGLFSFASTTLILSLYNVQARGIKTPNVVVGMALGVGGLAQLLAGMWEFAAANTFGATGKPLDPRRLFSPSLCLFAVVVGHPESILGTPPNFSSNAIVPTRLSDTMVSISSATIACVGFLPEISLLAFNFVTSHIRC